MTLKLSWKVYLILVLVAVVSGAASISLNLSDFLKNLFNIPVVGALSGITIQIFRDQATFERNTLLQQKQQDYGLSVTSHMASVTFDKHVEFCEAYMNQAQEGFMKLMSKGPTPDAAGIALDLKCLRLKHVMWVSPDVHKKQEYFERALFDIGMLSPARGETLAGLEDVKMLEEARHLFDVITGEKKSLTPYEENIAITKITEHLREVLGANELFALRKKAISDALIRTKEA